jgi:hypothetical protein
MSTQFATNRAVSEGVQSQLRDAWLGMAGRIARPQTHRWRFDDAAKGRPMKFLGSYPEVAEACVEAGASFHDIARPLTVMLAHLRRRCGVGGGCLKTAIANAEKEEGEAEAAEMLLALSLDNPDPRLRADFIREKREQLAAEENVLELVEDLHYGRSR